MEYITDVTSLRAVVGRWRAEGLSVALVPTMGNLHAGHMSLVELALAHCDRVVTSVFVNPTQFAPHEDFDRYPRTLEADRAALAAHGCHALFVPDVAAMYPLGPEQAVQIHLPGLSAILEGAHRPTHFDGVCTVVLRLFTLVTPDVAVFGRKDFQQWRIVQRMARDLSLPIDVVGAPIKRADDGLALSSRNQYLSVNERAKAPGLQETLQWMRAEHARGLPVVAIEQGAHERLVERGFLPDYIVIRRASDLLPPQEGERDDLIALAAARMGTTRLLDNLEF